MKSIPLYVALFLMVLTLGLWHSDAQAQGGMGEWIFDTTINPDSTPLEISGGAVFPDLDTFIVLDQTDLANLQVYNINRNTRTVESTSTIPVNTPAFGLGHVIRSANDTAHSCFVDDSQHRLYATHSENAVDWDKLLVSNDTDFSSCDTAVENGNVFVGACNFGADEYRVYQSADNGQTWNLIETINNVLCAFEGGTRANFNRIGGESVIFYMTGFNAVVAAEKDQLDTTRLVAPGELIVVRGNAMSMIDQDSMGPPLAESYPGGFVGEVTIIPYYHRESNTVRVYVHDPINRTPEIVIVLGDAPLFIQFFGITCAEGPKGIANIIYPGKHFQFDTIKGDFVVTEVGSLPFRIPTDGPIASAQHELPTEEDPDFPIQNMNNKLTRIFFGAGYAGGSFDYAQFGRIGSRPIPTLSEWGLIALSGVLMLSGAVYLRRRKVMS